MLYSLLACVGVLGVVSGRFLHCADDPKCAQEGNVSEVMTSVMKLIEKSRVECRAAGTCPLATQTVTGASKPCVNGLSDGLYPCSNIDMLSFVSLADLGSDKANGNDIWGWVDGDDKYALVGLTDGSSIVDVTDPLNPVVRAWLPSNVGNQVTWRDLKVFKDYLYVVADDSRNNHQLQYFDLNVVRELKANQTRAGRKGRHRPATVQPTGNYGDFGKCHNIAINEATGYLYAIGTKTCNGGLHIVNLDTADRVPRYAGCYQEDGYTHDAECVVYHGDDTTYKGKEVCFAYNEDTLTIVNVENKANPVLISRNPYNGAQYTHQGWCTKDHNHLLLNDELDEVRGVNDGYPETYIWDISSLSNPKLVNSYFSPVKSIDHNLYIKNNYGYLSNYESGLRIVDTSKIADGELTEVAYFDVYPQGDSLNFLGSWSVFPFFDDTDTSFVVVQSIDRGLFVLQPNL